MSVLYDVQNSQNTSFDIYVITIKIYMYMNKYNYWINHQAYGLF